MLHLGELLHMVEHRCNVPWSLQPGPIPTQRRGHPHAQPRRDIGGRCTGIRVSSWNMAPPCTCAHLLGTQRVKNNVLHGQPCRLRGFSAWHVFVSMWRSAYGPTYLFYLIGTEHVEMPTKSHCRCLICARNDFLHVLDLKIMVILCTWGQMYKILHVGLSLKYWVTLIHLWLKLICIYRNKHVLLVLQPVSIVGMCL